MVIKNEGSYLLECLISPTYECVCFDVNATNKRREGEVTNYDPGNVEVWN